MICVWEISCKLKLIKCILPGDEPYYCIPDHCALSGKHCLFVFFPKQHPPIWLPTICPPLHFHSVVLTKRNSSPPSLKNHNESPEISKEQVSGQNTCRKFGAVAAACCVCVWCPYKRIMAVSLGTNLYSVDLNSCVALQSYPYWYLQAYIVVCFLFTYKTKKAMKYKKL